MLNHIWFWMIMSSLIFAVLNDTGIIDISKYNSKQNFSSDEKPNSGEEKKSIIKNTYLGRVTNGAMDAASTALKLSIGLIGVMALFLGIMKVAETAGIIQKMGLLIRPITRFLFPSIPADHPAIGAMIMNMSANMLGLSNAATPMGLKAMEELQKLNKTKGKASNDMITFLVINTSAITLIPATAIALRVELNSMEPLKIIIPGIIAASCATIAGLTVVKLIQRLHKNKSQDKPNL